MKNKITFEDQLLLKVANFVNPRTALIQEGLGQLMPYLPSSVQDLSQEVRDVPNQLSDFFTERGSSDEKIPIKAPEENPTKKDDSIKSDETFLKAIDNLMADAKNIKDRMESSADKKSTSTSSIQSQDFYTDDRDMPLSNKVTLDLPNIQL